MKIQVHHRINNQMIHLNIPIPLTDFDLWSQLDLYQVLRHFIFNKT